jgi:3-hydroxyisobutyrate dehydrogenase-like beta-hydroxyacid dehydrogenase
MKERIGFVGLGNMGRPMAANLVEAGFDLAVFNRTCGKADGVPGMRPVDRPCDTLEPSGVVVSMVSDDRALESVTLGEGGIVERLGPGGVHLSMSTVAPETSRKLAEEHYQRGAAFVAGPVFGRPDAAAARKLWICVSGPSTAKARLQSVFDALGQGVFDFGEDPGAASVVKLAGNFIIASMMEALAEAFTLAAKNGVERTRLHDMLSRSLFNCAVYRSYGQLIAEERYTPPLFKLTLGLKDINLALQAAADSRMAMPLASLLRDRFYTALAKGREQLDWSAIALGAAEDAGLR